MDETKEGGDYPDYDNNNNINVEPSPFAPSDLSISGIDTSQSSHKNSIILREKIVIVGDAAVGKSSIVQSFLSQGSENFHNNKYLMTTDVDLNVKQVPIPDTNITVDLFLFDMAGQSIFNQRELLSRCWKDCSYIMCVFDISSRKTLQSCETWIQAIHSSRRKEGNVDQIPTILVANKVDLRQSVDSIVEVDEDEGIRFAKDHELKYFDCCKERSTSVDAPFIHVATQAAARYQEERDIENFEDDTLIV